MTQQVALTPEMSRLLQCLGMSSLVELNNLYSLGKLVPVEQATPQGKTDATALPTEIRNYQPPAQAGQPTNLAETQIYKGPPRTQQGKNFPKLEYPINKNIPTDPELLNSKDEDWVFGYNPYKRHSSIARSLLARENSDLGLKRIISKLLRSEGVEKFDLSVKTEKAVTEVRVDCSYRVQLATVQGPIPEVQKLMKEGRKEEAVNWLNFNQKEYLDGSSGENLHSVLHRVLTDLIVRFPNVRTEVVEAPHTNHAVTDKDGVLWEVANARLKLSIPSNEVILS